FAGKKVVEFGQGQRERAAVAQRGGGEVVGDQFAFAADAARQPPGRRVVEQQGFGQPLQQVDQVVVAADMRQFVGDQRFQQGRRHPQRQRRRQQHHRPPPADRQRRAGGVGQAQRDRD